MLYGVKLTMKATYHTVINVIVSSPPSSNLYAKVTVCEDKAFKVITKEGMKM